VLEREELDFWACAGEILNRMRICCGGVLCTVADRKGKWNVLTLGWGQIGPSYRDHPVFIIAVTPIRYSWRFLEETREFVIAVPDDSLRSAADLCGTTSGRDVDKFKATGLTPMPGVHVRPPAARRAAMRAGKACLLSHGFSDRRVGTTTW
jgi:flavin reductase (DIM6/NTAB) family NADH-FMN oxidoreductase RutF